MRFQLTGDWPCDGGANLIPVGTILDRDRWGSLPWPPPINAAALDQAAYDLLLQHYPYNRILTAGEGIIRHGDPKPK
jgi:hypothetical protein